jgi:hypothetical protein
MDILKYLAKKQGFKASLDEIRQYIRDDVRFKALADDLPDQTSKSVLEELVSAHITTYREKNLIKEDDGHFSLTYEGKIKLAGVKKTVCYESAITPEQLEFMREIKQFQSDGKQEFNFRYFLDEVLEYLENKKTASQEEIICYISEKHLRKIPSRIVPGLELMESYGFIKKRIEGLSENDLDKILIELYQSPEQ